MPCSRIIQIACPEHQRLVRGTYVPDQRGRFLYAADGGFLLNMVRCGQMEGRCMQTLCALHRYNRGGPGSWYPDRIYAMPERKHTCPRSANRRKPPGGSISIEA
jgi:hypothetical protein